MKTAEQAITEVGELSGRMKLIEWQMGAEEPRGLDLQTATVTLMSIYVDKDKRTDELITDTYETLQVVEEATFEESKENLVN